MSDVNVTTEVTTADRDRHASIVKAAALVMYRKGYDATSMNDIADAVNLTKAGLYYYTKGKQDLLYMIVKWAMDVVEEHIVQPARGVDDPELRLREMVRNHLRSIMVGSGAVTILTVEVDKLAPEHRTLIKQRNREYVNLVCETLNELKETGRLRPMDTMIAALNMFATILGIARWYQPDGRLAQEDVIEEVSTFVLGGLLTDQ